MTVFTDGPFFSYDGQEQVDGASITVNTSETDDINITCNVTATNPIVTSLNLTRPLANNTHFDNGTGVITITDITIGNAGIYTCTADNGETTPTKISFVLVVNSQPTATTTKPMTDPTSEFTSPFTKHSHTMHYCLLTEKLHFAKTVDLWVYTQCWWSG